jgi:hypothetical protein
MINHTPPFPMNSSHEMPPPSSTRSLKSFGLWNRPGGWVILFFGFIGAFEFLPILGGSQTCSCKNQPLCISSNSPPIFFENIDNLIDWPF